MDAVFRALADSSRRRLLDSLNSRNGQSLRELCVSLRAGAAEPDSAMTRQAVAKHLAVLEAANLVTVVRRGREKLHYLNPVPINDIAERWINRYDRTRIGALADLKHALEDTPMSKPEFVYVTYIKTTPEKVWQALTDPAFIRRYFEDAGPKSDFKAGSKVWWRITADGDYQDWGQEVLESVPHRRLSYTWHNYEPEMAEMFGWSEEKLAELRKESRSKVTFDIEPSGESVKLTVTHDGFDFETEMLLSISEGWPAILSNIKSLLETGDVMVTG